MWVKKDPIFFYRGEIVYVKFPENRIAYYDHYISGVEPYSKEVSPDIVYKVEVIQSFFGVVNGIIIGEYSNGSFIDSKLQGYRIVIYPNNDKVYKWEGGGVPVLPLDTTSLKKLAASKLSEEEREYVRDNFLLYDNVPDYLKGELDKHNLQSTEELLHDIELENILNLLKPQIIREYIKSNRIKLGGKKKVNIPKKYTKGLKKKDKVTQENDIKKAMKGYKKGKYIPRRKFKTFKNKPSTYTTKFKELYPNAKTLKDISKVTGIPLKAIKEVKKKGMGAYYSSGSRPNQTAQSWGMARVFSYILGGKTRKPDQHITEKYNVTFKHNIKFK